MEFSFVTIITISGTSSLFTKNNKSIAIVFLNIRD